MFFNFTLVEKQEAICSAGILGLDIGWSPKGLSICSEFGLGWAKQCVRILVGHGREESQVTDTDFLWQVQYFRCLREVLCDPTSFLCGRCNIFVSCEKFFVVLRSFSRKRPRRVLLRKALPSKTAEMMAVLKDCHHRLPK